MQIKKGYLTKDGVLFKDFNEARIHEEYYDEYMKCHDNPLGSRKRFTSKNNLLIKNYKKKITIPELIASNYMCLLTTLYTIYMWYDVKTRKVYVGCTKDIINRAKLFVSESSNYSEWGTYIDKIREKRFKNKEKTWILFILEYSNTKEDARKIESSYISQFNSTCFMYGYNIRK